MAIQAGDEGALLLAVAAAPVRHTQGSTWLGLGLGLGLAGRRGRAGTPHTGPEPLD